MVEISTYNPAPDLEGYKMRIYCFNQEFISCSTNGNDPTPNKILLTRSIYGWDDVRAQWRPPSQSTLFLIAIQCLTLWIFVSQPGLSLLSLDEKNTFHWTLFQSVLKVLNDTIFISIVTNDFTDILTLRQPMSLQ